jgi:hypothetical protein
LSAVLHGGHRVKSVRMLLASAKKRIARGDNPDNIVKGWQSRFGGHFRVVQGFRYDGEAAVKASS